MSEEKIVLDSKNKQEIALQFLCDARDYLEIFSLLIIDNEVSERRYQSTFVSKATVNLIFSIECSLKSIISMSYINDDAIHGEELINQLRDRRKYGHNIQNLYAKAKQLGVELDLSSFVELRPSIHDRYAIETLDEFIRQESIRTLQWDKYFFPAQKALEIAEKEYENINSEKIEKT